jgi:hypothetical protein
MKIKYEIYREAGLIQVSANHSKKFTPEELEKKLIRKAKSLAEKDGILIKEIVTQESEDCVKIIY